jgi:hypothetical protein
VFVYTTCRDCGGLLHVTNNNTIHPGCTPKPTKLERLDQEWLEAVELENHTREHELHAELEEITNQPPRLLDAALHYAEWGWPVFPLKPHAKTPSTRNGFKDATTNPRHIRGWWNKYPDSNIGLPTGHAFDVIDIDPPQGSHSYIELLAKENPRTGKGPLPDCHGMVATASGGIHLYVKPTGKGNTVGIAPGIDHRGLGGYVVAPPSTLGTRGRDWSWTVKPSPAITGVGDDDA